MLCKPQAVLGDNHHRRRGRRCIFLLLLQLNRTLRKPYDAEISVQIGAAHLSKWLFPFVAILFFIDNTAEATEVEETAVKASINCGPWPVYQVTSLASCEYPVINKSMLGAIKKGRNRLLNSCLRCADGTCSAKNRDDLDSHSLFTCKMLFRAPLSIGFMTGASTSAATVMRSAKQDPYAQPVSATINYTISADGRVTDLHVADIDSALERSEVEQIIKAGAQSVRFLPLDIGGVTHPIAQIQGRFVLP